MGLTNFHILYKLTRIMSRRIEQINESIRKEISELFLREIEFPKGTLVTVTRVKTSRDLKYARIFVSVLPFKHSQEILKLLGKNVPHLQFLLGEKITMKFIPKISFALDTTEEEAEKIEEIFKTI
jgi:ribosome-binding factor A